MEATMNVKERALEGAKKFLLHRGYEILDENYTIGDDEIDFVVQDEDDAIVFIDFNFDYDGIPEEKINRDAFERIAASWLSSHQDCVGDVTVRGDILSMMILGESRALLRHHINCLSGGEG